ncbi:MAG: 23S rRNA (uracil(1939)-C(5))-methyltransferase RlmD [Elusimicrobia bacterium]|nr:23S rRNA (uracil(1939)-C(5))-methyltransferase RlmD [Elusimicrobiota bacterium]
MTATTREILTVAAERLAPEGEAIARAAGSPRVIFVPYAVPGDRLEVDVVAAKSSFARGRIRKVLEPSPERIAPKCPHHYAGPGGPPPCGGCDWQMLSYAAQLKHKRELVRDCLSRIAKLPDAPVAETIASPQPWGYRNKVQIPFGRRDGRVVAGFYAPGTHSIVDFQSCAVQPELSVRIALKVKELAASWRWPIYEEDSGRGWLRHLFVRTNSEGKALAALVTKSAEFPRREEFVSALRQAFPELLGLHHNVQPLKTSVVLGPHWKAVWGARAIEERVGRLRFLVSPGAFLQVNTPAAALLYDAALAAATEGGVRFKQALDLYCGAGTLTLWVAGAFARVQGVEENRDAVRDAWKNAELNGVKNARFTAGRAEAVLPRIKNELSGPTAALADPPRMGLSRAVLRFLTAPVFRRLVYVSCDPATFARDAGYLCQSGFKLKSVSPVDLFPQTSHVELVALLDRA